MTRLLGWEDKWLSTWREQCLHSLPEIVAGESTRTPPKQAEIKDGPLPEILPHLGIGEDALEA
jgi:hypothetical protein